MVNTNTCEEEKKTMIKKQKQKGIIHTEKSRDAMIKNETAQNEQSDAIMWWQRFSHSNRDRPDRCAGDY